MQRDLPYIEVSAKEERMVNKAFDTVIKKAFLKEKKLLDEYVILNSLSFTNEDYTKSMKSFSC